MQYLRMLPALTYLALAFLLPMTSLAQENFEPGYIVKHSGERYDGMINNLDWDKNPRSVLFRDASGNLNHFTPLNIREFSVGGERYVSAAVEIDPSSDGIEDLNYWPDFQPVKDTVFLMALVIGPKSLFYLKDAKEKEHFIISEGDGFQTLVYKRYFRKDADSTRFIAYNNKYIGQLIILFQDCPKMKGTVYAAKYQRTSLINIFESYYEECLGILPGYVNKPDRVKTAFGAVAGITVSGLKFTSSTDTWLPFTEGDYSPSIRPSLGLFADVILPRAQGKWSIYNELVFTSYSFEDEYVDYDHEQKYTIYSTELAFSYIKLINAAKFRYPLGKTIVYAHAGISNGFTVSSKNFQEAESHLFNQIKIETTEAITDPVNWEFGFIGGTGANLGRFGLEFRYERGTGISNFFTLKSRTNRYYILATFRF